MKTNKTIFDNEKVKKILWQMANNIIALLIAVYTIYETQNPYLAGTVGAIVRALAEIGTRYFNQKING